VAISHPLLVYAVYLSAQDLGIIVEVLRWLQGVPRNIIGGGRAEIHVEVLPDIRRPGRWSRLKRGIIPGYSLWEKKEINIPKVFLAGFGSASNLRS